MTDKSKKVTYFAETDARGKKIRFGIKAKDRTRHVYVIGKTGMGKSVLLENMAVQDIQNGEGFAFVDPHGRSADLLLDYIPEERLKDVIYFAPFDVDNPISFNIMEDVGYDKRHLVVAGLMSAFKKIWVDMWSSRMEYILSNVLFALLEYPGATLLGVNRMFVDKDYRKSVIDNVTDPSVKSFWVDEFSKYTDRYTQDATPAIQNKIGQFTSNPLIRNIIGQSNSSFDIRKLMDEKKIIIINLSKGQIGEGNANLLGSMLITKIYLAAMSRADLPQAEMEKLPNFYLLLDEFQSFANESFADVLSEARKYKLNLTIAHQYIEQMPDEVRSAVFGNAGTMITFRVGAYDAEVLEKEFAPVFMAEDLVNLGKFQIYLKLMVDDIGSHPFSATTIPPIPPLEKSLRKEVIESSRKSFAKPRSEVTHDIDEWYKPIVLPKKEKPTIQKKEWAPKDTKKETIAPAQKRFPPRPAPTSSGSVPTVNATHTVRDNIPRKEQSSPRTQRMPQNDISTTPATVSLDSLKRGSSKIISQQKKNDKGPTPEKMKSLKEALEEAMKEKTPSKVEKSAKIISRDISKESRSTPKLKSNNENVIPTPVKKAVENQKEVPEETLKKILE